jgi:hypothetical protein
MNNRNLLIALGCGLIVVCLTCMACIVLFGGSIAAIFALTQPVVDATDAFFTDVQAENWQAAYDKTGPNLQADLDTVEDFQVFFETNAPGVQSWTVVNRSITNNVGETGGVLTLEDGTELNYTLTFSQSGDDWLVNSINLTR